MVRRFTFDICDVEDNDNIWHIMANKSSSQHVSIISSEEVGADLFKTGSFSIAGNVNVRARRVKPTKALKHTCGQTDPTT